MLHFKSSMSKSKPENIVNRQTTCPFCDTERLTNILDRDGSIIWLENKYPTLIDTYQTIIIETDQCESELSEYDQEHIRKLLNFTMNKWFDMQNSGKYASILLYKNHGHLSGGTIKHPHMQIVGLQNVDYKTNIQLDHFKGEIIDQARNVSLTISDFPIVGFTELNIKMDEHYEQDDIDQLAIYLQSCTHFLLNYIKCNSYNLFFYKIDKHIYVKIMPRFVTSPLFVGYCIPQISDHKYEIIKNMQELYFN
ncbi:DUF4931 domain-containing protein [Bacillus solimangrovi]|uniref:DUF4931 domain-containing protein n=1 Tax=Bacillus solimangrovi TaxID=1305675 RepID=A0A1E5LEC0_9BACI|nr:DUF4931 domain-containing protein [Bacillus solimangrovi]OEH92437.1 DUF4931 domain-containing protein [Bacillus solimangrovi]